MDSSKLKDALYSARPMTKIDWLVDIVIAMGAFGFGLLQLNVSANLLVPDEFIRRIIGIRSVAPSTTMVVLLALSCVPLVIRRRMPWIAFALSYGFWVFGEFYAGAISLSLVAPLMALFTVAYERTLGEGVAALAITLVAVVVVPYTSETGTLSSLLLVQNIALAVAVALGGYALHNRQDYLIAAEARAEEAEALRQSEAQRAEQAELTRETEAQRRVEEERLRIAREVHDITAHSLSAVSIQAAAAERLVDSDPEGAKAAIAAVRETAKESLDEMRAMVNVLRSGDFSSEGAGAEGKGSEPVSGKTAAAAQRVETQPTQGTDQLAELGGYLERAGIATSIDAAHYDRAQVPTYIDVALFGIAREATTNIAKHARASRARIELDTQGQAARLVVEDDGCGASHEQIGSTSGHGIEGMRERLNLLGGTLEIKSSELGGLKVCASVPLPEYGGGSHAV